ncbi:hypothetical protein F5B17DRAFT_405252 [Nemania serpens]|nr:hypothetical protein F5B17DRAFT_405252 [Nemania serpens]
MMNYQWELDEAENAAERKEFEVKEIVEVRLKRRRFNWLSRENHGASYISYNQFNNLPANAFEFGADGFAGACNFGGELLHLSAPSKDHGLVFARGAFSNSLYACLSRAQMESGGSATFGLRLFAGKESNFRLGNMVERGCFNYRWPVNEYSLFSTKDKNSSETEVGTCTRFSYIKDGVCYQVMRLEQRSLPDVNQGGAYPLFPKDGNIVLDIGGSISFQLLKSMSASNNEGSCSAESFEDKSSSNCLRLIHESQDIRLEARVYQLDQSATDDPSADDDDSADEVDPFILLDLQHIDPISESSNLYPSCQSSSLKPQFSSSTNFSAAPSSTPYLFATQVPTVTSSTDHGSIVTAPVEWVYRATAKLHPSSKKCGGPRNRSETFIAAIRLVQGGDPVTETKSPSIPSSKKMHQDVWVEPVRWDRVLDPESQGTGVMWETILQSRALHTDSMTEFTEISLMARCLEKILQVDLVPDFYGTENQPMALISNLFMHPTVNLRSLFWKVRFLVKVYGFLDGISKGTPIDLQSPEVSSDSTGRNDIKQAEETDSIPDVPGFFSQFDELDRSLMLKIAQSQCNRIREAIERIMSFLIKLLLPSEDPQEEDRSPTDELSSLMPQSPADQSEFYYIAMTIWYVVRSIPRTTWTSTARLRDFTQEQMKYSCIPADNHNFGAADKRKIILLKWYHYGSLLMLANRRILPASWRFGMMKKRVYDLSNAATMACTGMTASKLHYSVDNEIIDRLSFLARELGMEEFDATAETVTSAAIQRVRCREFTKHLNPGVSLQSGRGYNSQETCGPWEIHALCHNSRLNLLTLENDTEYMKATKYWQGSQAREEEVAMYKDKVNQFLNSEATLIPSWERSPMRLRSGWLQSEATAVHGSTLLDIHKRVPVVPKLSPRNSPQVSAKEDQSSERNRLHGTSLDTIIQGRLGNSSLSTQFRGIVNGMKETKTSPIDWVSFRPPRQYYPDNFVNSLEDTPHLFRQPFIDSIFVPTTLARFARQPNSGEIDSDTLKRALDEVHGSISVLDILASQQHSGPRKGESSTEGKTPLPDIRYYLGNDLPAQVPRDKVSPNNSSTEMVSQKRALINTHTKEIPDKDPLFMALYDSLVDQSVQHRVLNLTRLTESLVRMLVVVIHPEAAACLSNHVLHIPRFTSLKGPTWTTSITLGSWSLTDCEVVTLKHGSVMAKEFIQLPEELKDADIAPHPFRRPNSGVSFFVSSVMLSTNAFGDFSRCTIISEGIDGRSTGEGDELRELVEIANETWQVFVHQPQTARCLVFLHILGMLCTRLCENYRGTIAGFASSLDATDAFLLKEVDWTHDDSSLSHFECILWSLDCLCKFQNSLKASLSSILDAKRELLGEILEQAPQRSQSLQGMCQEYVAKFESSVVELSQVNEYLESNIALAVRFKDALSGTLALRDSRVGLKQNQISLEQNNAIQALTYLTIGYLPLGLISAIFAIPKEQDVVFLPMGRGWFIGAILILSVVTYSVVAWLNHIVDFFKFPDTKYSEIKAFECKSSEAKLPEARNRGEDKQRPNLWKMLGCVRKRHPSKEKKSPV